MVQVLEKSATATFLTFQPITFSITDPLLMMLLMMIEHFKISSKELQRIQDLVFLP